MAVDTEPRPVRIGCYSAFWGDSAAAASQLVKHEHKALDYLVADYLAEITMGILAARRKRRRLLQEKGKSNRGGGQDVDFIPEFLTLVLRQILPAIAVNGTKVITNAGALDPLGCKAAIEKMLEKMNLSTIKVAAVVGDDLLADKETHTLASFEGLHSFSPVSTSDHTREADRLPGKDEPIVSLNAYLGSKAVAAALASGAQIVVTGRVVDSALVVGPLMYEYGWQAEQPGYLDLLASASLAGHIVECGCHATGGNFTDWRLAADSGYGGYANMGYPIVEFQDNGDFVVTKPTRTGGLVTPATVSEQIVYETLDPAQYLLPDVVLDLRQVTLTVVGQDRVLVRGAKGSAPTPWLKCSGIFLDGWKLTAELLIGGVEAKQKAIAVGEAILRRVRTMFQETGMVDFRNFNLEPLGGESLYGANAQEAVESREVVLRLTAHHNDPDALQLFAREVIPAVTCMAPGITGGGSGRPKPAPNMVHFPCLIPKDKVHTRFQVGDAPLQSVAWDVWPKKVCPSIPVPAIPEATLDEDSLVTTKLIRVAYGRSGDKGDVANIGIIARDPAYLPYLKRALTEQAVAQYMKHLCKGNVTRYELPGLLAFNFVLTRALGGGGLSSLRVDRQGKTFAQVLLSGFDVKMPLHLLPNDARL